MSARIRWMASIVASVPELAKRHRGRWKRRDSSSASQIESAVGWAKWVPRVTCSEKTARTMEGCPWPAIAAPYPPCMSTYSLPSTSQTWEPLAVAHPDGLGLR